ncbi:MAG: hypothetical protein USCGTAYLOR_00096 [Chromatiales bacterium USCg_Taylor]|nr:MAG: hypothetical protein USCGTAYLOR_00096 [Chromatiales bacterium USCg_Taylor]
MTGPAIYQRHRLTVADYHRIGKAGILSEDDRVELIEGEMVDMAPIGSEHAAVVIGTQLLATESVVAGLLSQPSGEYAVLDDATLETIRTRREGHATKVINLVKAIEKRAEENRDDPFLVALTEERARAVQESFEDRQPQKRWPSYIKKSRRTSSARRNRPRRGWIP